VLTLKRHKTRIEKTKVTKRVASVKKTSAVKKVSTGSSASKRADGIAKKGKTRGKMV
jgi:hypothetical protein